LGIWLIWPTVGPIEQRPATRSPIDHVTNMKAWSVSVFGAIAVICILLSVATVWILLTDPVTVANAVNEGEVTPLVQDFANLILDALRGLLKYL
jgi:hypothetical protein